MCRLQNDLINKDNEEIDDFLDTIKYYTDDFINLINSLFDISFKEKENCSNL